jgi:protoporphyrinogen IX oxidase
MYWPPHTAALLAAHVFANMVWIGALLAEAVLLGSVRLQADPQLAGLLTRRVHTRLAVPACLGSLATGLVLLVPARRLWVGTPWMGAKIGFAVAVIALHLVIGSRARRVAEDRADDARGAWALGWLVLLASGAAVLLSVAKSTP